MHPDLSPLAVTLGCEGQGGHSCHTIILPPTLRPQCPQQLCVNIIIITILAGGEGVLRLVPITKYSALKCEEKSYRRTLYGEKLANLCRSPSISDIGHKDTEEGVASEQQRVVINRAGLVTV